MVTGKAQHQVVAFVLWSVLVVVVHGGAVMIELILWHRAAKCLAYGRGVHPELTYEPPHVLGVTEVGDILRRRVPA